MNEVSKPLPLFRLPAIPLTMISRYMDLQEILLISLTSKKSAYIMRSLLPPNWFNLKLSFHNETKIVLGAKGTWDRDPVTIKGQRDGYFFKLQVTQPSGDVSYQWAGPQLQELVKILLTHFATVFNPTVSIHVEKVYSQDFLMNMMNQVKQLNFMITSLKIFAYISPENYKYTLNEFKEVPEIWLFCKTSLDFDCRARPDLRSDFLHVSDGHWMHLEDFSNCREVAVGNCSRYKQLTYANLEVPRALIRKWIESDCRLEHFSVSSFPVEFDFRLVLQGLGFRTTELSEKSQSVEITRRCDGKKATVNCGLYHFELKVND